MYIKRLKNLREDHDLTQTQISKFLNISQRAYSHYEQGTREIPIELLIQLAHYYNTSIDYILEETDCPLPYK
jgi:transcriptional regulator with XRE-family HTH domain